jgi:hypothetical protein
VVAFVAEKFVRPIKVPEATFARSWPVTAKFVEVAEVVVALIIERFVIVDEAVVIRPPVVVKRPKPFTESTFVREEF